MFFSLCHIFLKEPNLSDSHVNNFASLDLYFITNFKAFMARRFGGHFFDYHPGALSLILVCYHTDSMNMSNGNIHVKVSDISNAIFEIQNDKSPGIDGLNSIYVVVWITPKIFNADYDGFNINSSPLDKWPPFHRRSFHIHFCEWKRFVCWFLTTTIQHLFR